MKLYMVVIKTSPTSGYGPLVGWDEIYTTRRAAVAARDRARKHWAARVVSATPERAKEFGWR